MQDKLKSFIEDLKADRRIASFDEAATKQVVILKILSILGWDTFDIDEVIPEYSVAGKRVDYSLRVNNVNKAFIEVKRIVEALENHQEQLLNYSFQEGVKLAILTNGSTWWFYLPLHEGSWEQRRFYAIDILQQESDDIVSRFIDFLSRENIRSGEALKSAEAVYKSKQKQNVLQSTLPKAWNKIISDADELLIELINETTEKLCGYKADDLLVEEFLSRYADQLLIGATPTPKETKSPLKKVLAKPTEIVTGHYSGRKISSFSFMGKKYEVKFWKELLMTLCNVLNGIHKNEFDRVLRIVGRKRPSFTRNSLELRSPQRINNTNIYVETNLSANSIVRLCREVLSLFGYSSNDLTIEAL